MKFVYGLQKELHTIDIDRAGDEFELQVEGKAAHVRVIASTPPRITFLYQDKIVTAHVASDGKKRWIHVDGATFVLERQDSISRGGHSHGAREGTGSGIVVAPMPGQVRGVLVNEGDAVQEGQPLILLEAMKMELKVSAPRAGVVSKIHVTKGQSVEREQVLGEIRDE
jgi:biotin carboxyl carrier protein